MKLGKLAARFDSRTLRLPKYIRPGIFPPAPPFRDWSAAVPSWPMLGNNDYGDCTVASALHLDQTWADNAGAPFVPITAQALAAYSAITGFSPANPATDNGAVLLDVLNYWRNTGIAGRKILAYVSVNMKNEAEVKQAINLFGGLYIGLLLPLAWQTADIWDAPAAGRQGFFARLFSRVKRAAANWTPGSWGGHAVPLVQYSPGIYQCITWGAKKKITAAGLTGFADEGYAVLSQDWISAKGLSPAGFDMTTLQKDLQAVAASTMQRVAGAGKKYVRFISNDFDSPTGFC
jgi:hypothetical protein